MNFGLFHNEYRFTSQIGGGMNAPKEYEIEGLEIVDYDRSEGYYLKYPFTYECVTYHANDFNFIVAKDILGIQVCREGIFCKQPAFASMLEAVKWLRNNVDNVVTFYTNMIMREKWTKQRS